MKKELEICVRALVDFEELKAKMLDMGFKVQEDFQEYYPSVTVY